MREGEGERIMKGGGREKENCESRRRKEEGERILREGEEES